LARLRMVDGQPIGTNDIAYITEVPPGRQITGEDRSFSDSHLNLRDLSSEAAQHKPVGLPRAEVIERAQTHDPHTVRLEILVAQHILCDFRDGVRITGAKRLVLADRHL